MKPQFVIRNWLAGGLAGLSVLAGTCSSQGQVTAQNPQPFDTALGSWTIWSGWGIQGFPLIFDPMLDAANNPNSGSMRYEVPFTGAGGEQFMTFGTLANRWAW